jgi:UDP-2-acetamido-3-amino-2,3-dideoxy-glucuronate N-acetyltransferase
MGWIRKPATFANLGSVTMEFYAHPSAIVEEGAQIGPGSKVWHHGHVRSGAQIGADCIFGKNVYVDSGAVVGDRVKIQNNVSVYVGVTICDDVFVGPSATFTNDLVPRAFNADWQIVPTNVGVGSSIGANSTIVCGNDIGEYAMVAAGATVTRDVRPHELVAGTPARTLGWVCRCGKYVGKSTEPPSNLVCDSCGSVSNDV